MRVCGLILLTTAGTVAGCMSFEAPPPYDASFVTRVQLGAPAGQVRTILGKPTTAMPAAMPVLATDQYPGCNTVAEEWQYSFAACEVKLIFNEEGQLCQTRPIGLCGRRVLR